MTHIHIDAPFWQGRQIALIGDSLAAVPFLNSFSHRVRVTGLFNEHVKPLISHLPIDFEPPHVSSAGAHFTIGAQRARDTNQDTGSVLHMAQCHFHACSRPLPRLPIYPPMQAEPCDLPRGVVVAPFSFSDVGANKFWPHERWVHVIQTLRRLNLATHAYVLGSSATDSTAHYAVAGITPVFDRPLTQVLSLLRKATLVLTVDNGIAHLAHFGGVTRHVHIYPDTMLPRFAEAPMALHARGPTPAHISADRVTELATRVLRNDG